MTATENLLRFARREEYDYVPEKLKYLKLADGRVLNSVCGGRGLEESGLVQSIDLPACERPMFGEGYDIFGVHWSKTDGVSHYTPGQSPIYDDIESWRDGVRIPVVERLDWKTFERQAKTLDPENHLISAVSMCGLFERATMLTTMENCLMDMISDPDSFRAMLEAVADYKIALLKKACEYIRIDLLIYHDDWGTNVSTFMSPELWEETVKPPTQRLYDELDALGITIIQHSCGCVHPFIPRVIDMGVKMMDLQLNRYNIAEIAEKYGDRMFFTVNDITGGSPPKGEDGPTAVPADGDGPPPFMNLYPAYPEKPEFLYD